ncbi:MAG: hypothetical protein HKN22_06190, partial [Bacteroidia bacterium]|nr:hypothetical protein [Bacteroidia bacterium]
MKVILAGILLIFISAAVEAQNKMTLLNGKEINISNYEVGDYLIEYEIEKRNKIRSRRLNKFKVFDIANADGSTVVIYEQDSLDRLSMSVKQVRDYIDGEQYALKTYRADMNSAGSFVVGAGSGLFTFYGLPIPVVYG